MKLVLAVASACFAAILILSQVKSNDQVKPKESELTVEHLVILNDVPKLKAKLRDDPSAAHNRNSLE